MRRSGTMQEHLVFSTFSRARHSVISRTRKAFTPRALIKDGESNEDPGNEPADTARSSVRDTADPKISEGTAASTISPIAGADSRMLEKDEEIQNYKVQIDRLEKKIVELEHDEANQLRSAEAHIAQIVSLEDKVKELELVNSSKAEEANTYSAHAEELREVVKKLKEDEASRNTRAEEYKAQLEELETKVELLRKEQRRVDDTDKTNGKLQREVEQQRKILTDRMNDTKTLNESLSQLRDESQKQSGLIVNQKHDIEAKDAKIIQLQQENQEHVKAINHHGDEMHAKDTQISQLLHESQTQHNALDSQKSELRAKDDTVTQLQLEVAEARQTVAANGAKTLPNFPLQRTEGELLDAWQALADAVEVFISTNLAEASTQQIRRWVRSQRNKIPAHSPPVFAGDVYVSRLVEASIWDALSRLVFADSTLFGGICWSGQYGSKISKLSGPILQAMESADQNTQGLFHFWKAATTNLLAALGPHAGREEKVVEIVGELLGLLGNLPIPLSREDLIVSLMSIVEQAVTLDEMLCGQQTWFSLRYPYQRSDIDLDLGEMDVEEGVSPGQSVKFVIRPALCKAGGGVDDAGALSIVKRHLVFV